MKIESIIIKGMFPTKYPIAIKPIKLIAREIYNILKLPFISIGLPHFESIDATSIIVARIVIGA
jgi:hypothetical protein